MDSIRVSEALDSSSILDGTTPKTHKIYLTILWVFYFGWGHGQWGWAHDRFIHWSI
jgi:hypothetical protein